MSKRVFKDENFEPINSQLDELEKVSQKRDELIKTEEKVVSSIRSGFRKRVIVFIDLVDSTKFKVINTTEPEKWILRIKQFSEIVAEYIEECGGKVVKYIGDELMGIFDRETRISDALNLIMRLKDIEKKLYEITNESAKLKIALDYGDVYLMAFEGHNESDPQGTPVDRCARIAKFCKPSTILTSYEFVSNSTYPNQWNEVGEIDLKGLGLTKIYQYMDKTVRVEKQIVLNESKYNEMNDAVQKLKSEIQEITIKLKDIDTKNKELSKMLEDKGSVVPESLKTNNNTKESESKELWQKIQNQITELRSIVGGSGVPENEYSRFLFLYNSGEGDRWNSFAGRTFDASIERKLVIQDSGDFFKLNIEHRRNQKAIMIMEELESYLKTYELEYRDDDNDLFNYSLEDPDFWRDYIGYYVT